MSETQSGSIQPESVQPESEADHDLVSSPPLPPTAAPAPASAFSASSWGPQPPAGVSALISPAPPARPGAGPLVAVALVAGLLGGGVGAGATLALSHPAATSTANVQPPPLPVLARSTPLPSTAAGSAQSASYASVAAAVLPSVVRINITTSKLAATGSGVVLTAGGEIVTNNHVVADAASDGVIRVTFQDGSTAIASIVGRDESSDLAVIRVRHAGMVPARFTSAADLHVGDPVLAVGSPLGLSGTVTAGIISALHRPVTTTLDPQAPVATVLSALQTDAAVNPGNSGGALANARGEVVGISSAIATLRSSSTDPTAQSGSIGLGFAIPSDAVLDVTRQLITTGHAVHAVLGVLPTEHSSPTTGTEVAVSGLTPGGPAGAAGVRVGDVILAVGDQNVHTAEELVATVRAHRVGEHVTLHLLRGGTPTTVEVTLAPSA